MLPWLGPPVVPFSTTALGEGTEQSLYPYSNLSTVLEDLVGDMCPLIEVP